MSGTRDPLLDVDQDGRLFVTINGVRLEVVDDAEAARVDFVVCAPDDGTSAFVDNVHTTCARCLTAIVHRPNLPTGPPRVCMSCASILVAERATP